MSETEQPESEHPATEQPETEQPIAEQPATEQPESEHPATDAGETVAVDHASTHASPAGIRRKDEQGREILDAMAGRASVFGFGFRPITEVIQQAAESYLGDGSAFADHLTGGDSAVRDGLVDVLGDSPAVAVDSVLLCASSDVAVEAAIGLARRHRPEKAFRTIALLGSDHGRTGLCRTASGRPELHEGFGPMMAGFAHVPAGDVDALRAVVDEQTACILISPIEFCSAAVSCDASYLTGLREICDQRGILLIIDETQIVFGASGRPLAYSAIADIRADVVLLSAGLFGGLAGAVVVASRHVSADALVDVGRYPLQAAVASKTLAEMSARGLPGSANDSNRSFVVALAERLSGFEFVRDVHALGMTVGIETDIDSADLVRAARQRGLLIEPSGETAVRLQPPLVTSDEDRQAMLVGLGEAMAAIERETADLST